MRGVHGVAWSTLVVHAYGCMSRAMVRAVRGLHDSGRVGVTVYSDAFDAYFAEYCSLMVMQRNWPTLAHTLYTSRIALYSLPSARTLSQAATIRSKRSSKRSSPAASCAPMAAFARICSAPNSSSSSVKWEKVDQNRPLTSWHHLSTGTS